MLYNTKLGFKKNKLRKKGKLRYGSKKYSNPFFQQKPSVKKRLAKVNFSFGWKMKFTSFLIIIFCAFILWALFYSNLFLIQNIQVEGGERISPASVEKIVRSQIKKNFYIFAPQKNLILFNKNRLKSELETKYAFDQLDINKKFPKTLNIAFKEKKYAFIWQEDEVFYYSDINGSIINEVNILEVKQKDYPIINNESDHKISNNIITVDNNYIQFVLDLFTEFNKLENYQIDRYLIDNEYDSVKVILENGPSIYFNTKVDIAKQLSKLAIIKSEKIKDDFSTKSYIDLRQEDRVYYR